MQRAASPSGTGGLVSGDVGVEWSEGTGKLDSTRDNTRFTGVARSTPDLSLFRGAKCWARIRLFSTNVRSEVPARAPAATATASTILLLCYIEPEECAYVCLSACFHLIKYSGKPGR